MMGWKVFYVVKDEMLRPCYGPSVSYTKSRRNYIRWDGTKRASWNHPKVQDVEGFNFFLSKDDAKRYRNNLSLSMSFIQCAYVIREIEAFSVFGYISGSANYFGQDLDMKIGITPTFRIRKG
jgi:hypothetical protein